MSSDPIVIYPAAKVITLDHARPVSDAVAVRGDRILAAGSREELSAFHGATVDDRYADRVIFPGFVEAHAHASSASVWRNIYLGYYPRKDLQGTVWSGCRSIDDVIDRLREADAKLTDPDELLVGWGLDPIYFTGERLLGRHLDLVSTTRPIYVQHANGHLATVNTALMRRDGIDRSLTVVGLAKDADGEPNGELQEFAAMALAGSARQRTMLGLDRDGLADFGTEACNAGLTTVVDLASSSMMTDEGMAVYRDVTESDTFPARLAPFHFGSMPTPGMSTADVTARLVALAAEGTAKLRLGYVKLILDGSIQSFTARLQEPGYLNHPENGIWIVTPEEFEETFAAFHRAGMLIHVHCNGDEATELMLDTVEKILTLFPRPDHRHTVTHSQLSTAAQYRRMAALGLCANIFSNHIWYWGDQHRDITVGADRAARMNAAATALREGVRISLHSDSPVTPLGPLATASYAVERKTASGRPFGPEEAIGLDAALRAMTLGAAYMLKLDAEIGSIEGGKRADFAVLGSDPYDVAEPAELREIEVHGTVLGGVHHEAKR